MVGDEDVAVARLVRAAAAVQWPGAASRWASTLRISERSTMASIKPVLERELGRLEALGQLLLDGVAG